MDIKILSRLQKLNQLKLTEDEESKVMAFFEKAEKDYEILNQKDTENVERMVHVIPLYNILREDKEIKLFTRDELQKAAPEATDGYWQVPRTVE